MAAGHASASYRGAGGNPGAAGACWRWHVAPIPMRCSECGGSIAAGTRFYVRWTRYAGVSGHGWQSDADEAVCASCQPQTALDDVLADPADDDADLYDDEEEW